MTRDEIYEQQVAITREKLLQVWSRPCPKPAPSAEGHHFCPLCKRWIDCRQEFCLDALNFIEDQRALKNSH